MRWCTAGRGLGKQLPAMLEFMRGAAILGHNVRFDLSFLAAEFRRQRRSMEADLPDAPVLDTVRMARRRFAGAGTDCRDCPGGWGSNRRRRIGRWPTR